MTTEHAFPSAATIARETLPNGITVLVYENPAVRSVVFVGSLNAGSGYETPEQSGLASFTASALMRGTQNADFLALHSALEDIGADLSFNTGNHRVTFGGKALAEDLSAVLGVLADALRHPIFPADQIERLRGEIVTGLQIRQQDTRYRAARAFYETLYPEGHAYHYPVRGTLETVSGITRDDLAHFHARHYAPQGMIIAIVGAVQPQTAFAAVRALFADWTPTDSVLPISVPVIEPPAETRRAFAPVAGKTQSDLIVGTVGMPRSSPDYYAALLANSVLGQFGMMGRVGASVREDLGLAYYVYSQLDAGISAGPWSIIAGVNPANVELALARILDEVRRLVETPVSAEELADNQSYYIGNLPLQLESSEGIAGVLHSMELYGLGLDYLIDYRQQIAALTPADLQRVAQRYLNPDALVIAVAGPTAQ